MTCKDCVHYSVCFITDEDVEKEVEEFGCNDFKDKSRFIELPCKVGDTFYEIEFVCTEGGNLEEQTYPTEYGCDCCESSECDKKAVITQRKFWTLATIIHNSNRIGKTIFLTREEAEKHLKKE